MTPTCAVCHVRAATRAVTLGGVGVQVCAVCVTRSPADVADAWRVRNAPQQSCNGGDNGE